MSKKSKVDMKTITAFHYDVDMGMGNAIHLYQKITRSLRVEENPDDAVSTITTFAQLAAEAGETLGKINKSMRDDRHVPWRGGLLGESPMVVMRETNPDRFDAIVKELGDTLFYLSEACNHMGITLFDLMHNNVSKLVKRESAGTLQGEGDDR